MWLHMYTDMNIRISVHNIIIMYVRVFVHAYLWKVVIIYNSFLYVHLYAYSCDHILCYTTAHTYTVPYSCSCTVAYSCSCCGTAAHVL